MSKSGENLEIVFEADFLKGEKVAKHILGALDVLDSEVELYGAPMDVKSAVKMIANANRNAFKLKTSKGEVHFSTVSKYKLQLINIRRNTQSVQSWNAIVSSFLQSDRFVQACVSDVDYSFWQNAVDPLQYQVAGRSYSNLPMVSNGLPAPLEQSVVDTSQNPGRRIIKVGYVEMIGHVMWLGNLFWDLVGKPKRSIMLDPGSCEVTEMPNGVVRVVVPEGPFVDVTTEQKQVDLRQLLFGRDNGLE